MYLIFLLIWGLLFPVTTALHDYLAFRSRTLPDDLDSHSKTWGLLYLLGIAFWGGVWIVLG